METKKIYKIIKETEQKVKGVKLTKDKALNADISKTIRAMAYEKIKSLFKERNENESKTKI